MNDNKQYDDKLLLSQISQGDEKAFNTFFERYRNQLFSYLYKITKSRELSEEIVLDVFLKLWLAREIVVEIQKPESFLFRVARNKTIDFFRSAKHDPIYQTQMWDWMQDAATSESADEKLLQKNAEDKINDAVKLLSPQRQKVYELHQNLGLSNKEIAKRLKLSGNTVKNHLAASLKFIRNYVRDEDNLLVFFVLLTLKKIFF